MPQGKVLAVDVQPEMIDILKFLKTENQADNVEPILGSVTDPNLPANSVDLALMVDAYHEFEYPKEMMEGNFCRPQTWRTSRAVRIPRRKSFDPD